MRQWRFYRHLQVSTILQILPRTMGIEALDPTFVSLADDQTGEGRKLDGAGKFLNTCILKIAVRCISLPRRIGNPVAFCNFHGK